MSDKVEIGKVLVCNNRTFGPISWLGPEGSFSTEPVFTSFKGIIPYIVLSDVIKHDVYNDVIQVFVPVVGKLMFLYDYEVIEDLKNMESSDE